MKCYRTVRAGGRAGSSCHSHFMPCHTPSQSHVTTTLVFSQAFWNLTFKCPPPTRTFRTFPLFFCFKRAPTMCKASFYSSRNLLCSVSASRDLVVAAWPLTKGRTQGREPMYAELPLCQAVVDIITLSLHSHRARQELSPP